MSNIDYSSVINNAIAYFNDTQNALSTLSAKRADGTTAIPVSSSSYIPASEFSSIISGQLQLKASEAYDISGVQTLSGGYYSINKDFSAVKTARVKQGILSDLTGTYDSKNNIYIISGGVTEAGWVPLNIQSLNISHATYTVSNGSISIDTSGYAQSGEVVGSIDGGSASILPAVDITGTILQTASSSGAYEIDVTPQASISAFSAGYFGSSDNITISSADSVKRYIKASSKSVVTSNSSTATVTMTPAQMVSITEGYSPSANIIKVDSSATASAANILSGKTAWVTGSKLTGSMTNRSSSTAISIANSNFSGTSVVSLSYVIPQGYYDGATSISGTYSIGSATLSASAPSLTQYNGDTVLESTNNIISTTTPAEGIDYYRFDVASNASVSAGYTAVNNASSTAVSYYLPKATFSYTSDSSNNKIISCSQPGYITTGDFTVSGTLDYAAITSTPTASTASIFVSSAPSSGEYYTITSNHSITSAGYVNSETSFTDEIRYLAKGALSALTSLPTGSTENTNKVVYNGYVKVKAGYYESDAYIGADISAGSVKNSAKGITISTLSIASTANAQGNYAVTGSNSATITPEVVSAGYISTDVGTKTGATVTGSVSASIPGTSLTAGNGAASMTTNSTAASGAGSSAILSASASGTYVIVRSSGSGSVSVGTGYTKAASKSSNTATATGYIPALVSPTVTVTSSSPSFSVGSATTFTSEGVMTAGSKANSATSSIAESEIPQVNNKYVIGELSVSKVSGTASASIETNSTGTTVDAYVQSLYKCILGSDYTPRAAD